MADSVRTDFGDGVAFFFRPLACRKPTWDEWLELIDSVARLGPSDGVDLAVIDPLIRAKLLLPMGVPYAAPAYRRTPGPYLPTVRAFLNATLL